MPIPAHPASNPIGIAMMQRKNASNSTQLNICFFVAPMDFKSPNCLVLSLIEIEKEL